MKFEPITLFSQASFWKVTVLRQAALFPKQEESLPKATKDQYYIKVLNIIAPAAVFGEPPFWTENCKKTLINSCLISFALTAKYALWPWSYVPLELKAKGLR